MVVFGRHIRRLCRPLGGQCDCIEDGEGGDGMELAGPVQLAISRYSRLAHSIASRSQSEAPVSNTSVHDACHPHNVGNTRVSR